MVPIKIECGCGQHYAFDVEPVNGQMPVAIVCPNCGADGTDAANQILSRQFAPIQPAATSDAIQIPAHSTPARLAAPPPAIAPVTRRPTLLPGQVTREQAASEARAKAMWGDSKNEVIKYLMMQGYTVPEAREVVDEAFAERAKAVRENGMHKIFAGIGLMCVPVFAWGFFLRIGYISIKLMGMACVVGLYGCWLLINGILMVVAPKSEKGDVADQ